MIISIAAIDQNNLLGADGKLIWEVREDMMHFKTKTMGNICIMGRVTWESINEKYRPLSGRLNIIITSNPNYPAPEAVLLAKDLNEAIQLAEDKDKAGEYFGKDIYICGGAQLYAAAMPIADELEITEIGKEFPVIGKSDLKYFPEIDVTEWYAADSTEHQTPEGLYFDFITYKRISTLKE